MNQAAGTGPVDVARLGVFISYRRGITSGQARALREHLALCLGPDRVFMDVDNIGIGADFVTQISLAIQSSGVLLALIGADWLSSETGERRFENPEDFIRLELAAAFECNLPVIPILIERTLMPARADLPEQLWPLLRRQALDLENNHWDYGVDKLLEAVTSRIGTSPRPADPGGDSHHRPAPRRPSDQASGARPPDDSTAQTDSSAPARRLNHDRWKRPPVMIAATVTALAAAAVAAAVFLSGGSTKRPTPSAATAALAVDRRKPDALAQSLLYGPILREVPAGVTGVGSVSLLTGRTTGLVAQLEVGLTGNDEYDVVYYNVFDNASDATAYFTGPLLDAGYLQTGSFSVPELGDPVRCITEHQAASAIAQASSGSSCFVRSGYVVTGIVTERSTSSPAGDTALTRSLAQDSVRRLARVAAGTAQRPEPGGQPSADGAASRLDGAGFTIGERLSTGNSPILSSPTYLDIPVSSTAPRGLKHEVSVAFVGPDRSDHVVYSVFGTATDAERWFAADHPPTGATSWGSIDSSGFAEPTRCATINYAKPPLGASACTSLAGNIVVAAYTAGGSDLHAGNSDLVVTMQRMALFHLYRVVGRPR